jgi:hypothetical protein
MEDSPMMWRIYENPDTACALLAGFGDHASLADARSTVERWGKIVTWERDRDHDAVDALVLPFHISGYVYLTIERLPAGAAAYPTN